MTFDELKSAANVRFNERAMIERMAKAALQAGNRAEYETLIASELPACVTHGMVSATVIQSESRTKRAKSCKRHVFFVGKAQVSEAVARSAMVIVR